MRKALLLLSLASVLSCGGGGSDSSCNALKVAGGESCSDGSSTVAVVVTLDSAGNPLEQCTGTYISLTSVLTAAHCFLTPSSGAIVATRGGGAVQAKSVHIPSAYNGSVDSAADIAILKVPVTTGTNPTPILLSRRPAAAEDVITYGYGTDQGGGNFISRVENGDQALKSTTLLYVDFESGTDLVVAADGGSTCQGDSGGPVLARDSNGRYGIFGITRSGPQGCSAEDGRPTFLTSVLTQGALDFIQTFAADFARN